MENSGNCENLIVCHEYTWLQKKVQVMSCIMNVQISLLLVFFNLTPQKLQEYQNSCQKYDQLLGMTVPRKRDHFVKSKMYSIAQTPTKNIFLLVFFLLAHRYPLPFSYADTKFEWLKPLLKVPASRLNTVTFYSLFRPGCPTLE